MEDKSFSMKLSIVYLSKTLILLEIFKKKFIINRKNITRLIMNRILGAVVILLVIFTLYMCSVLNWEFQKSVAAYFVYSVDSTSQMNEFLPSPKYE